MGLKLAFQLLIGLLPLIHVVYCASYDEVCGPVTHCDANVSLFCDNNICKCTGGPMSHQASYDLAWDSGKGRCAGQHGSACVGTRSHAALSSLPCLTNLTCIQVPGMPLGIGTCQNVPAVHLHDAECSEDLYCDASRSLVCNQGRCACSTSRNNTSPFYDLVWDTEMGDCLARIGSPCVGTREYPVPSGGKAIRCVPEADCVADVAATPGVGMCQSRQPTQEPPSTDGQSTPTNEDTTTDTSLSSRLTVSTALVIAVLAFILGTSNNQ